MNDNNSEHASCHQQENDPVHATQPDPVCGMPVVVGDNTLQHSYKGQDYYFCSNNCLKSFSINPESYLGSTQDSRRVYGIGIKPLPAGLAGMALLLIVFFGIVTLANGSLESAFQEFSRLWYWVLILSAGFGFQLGLFFHIRNRSQIKMTGATAEVAASGTISTGSMIACCSHGLVNLLPMLGISAAAAFLAQYQLPLILLGVFSNLLGVTIMLGIAKKHGSLPDNLLGRIVAPLNMHSLRYMTIVFGVIAIIISTYYSYLA